MIERQLLRVVAYSMLLFVLLTGCQPKCIPMAADGNGVIFGSGGGFRGNEMATLIWDNGCVYRRSDPQEEWDYYGTLTKKTRRLVFQKADEMILKDKMYSKPGNIYYFVEFTAVKKNGRIVWADHKNPPWQEIEDFYQFLRKAVKEAAPKD